MSTSRTQSTIVEPLYFQNTEEEQFGSKRFINNNPARVFSLEIGVFVEKKIWATLKTLKTVAMETKVCHMFKLWTSFQKNLTVGC